MKRPITLNEVKGQCLQLRALEIAQAGGHDTVLYGPAGSGKRTLAACFPNVKIQIIQSCPCGNHGSVIKECTCTPERLGRYHERMRRRTQHADICIVVCHVPLKELENPSSADPERESRMLARIAGAAKHTSLDLDDVARRTMEIAARRLSFTAGDHSRTMLVARTIANLDKQKTIGARHMTEAIQYSVPILAHLMDRWRY